MDLGLFNKYQNIEVVPQETLGGEFELPLLKSLKKGLCIYCGKPLREMKRPFYFCPRKKCPCYMQNRRAFIVSKEKIEKLMKKTPVDN